MFTQMNRLSLRTWSLFTVSILVLSFTLLFLLPAQVQADTYVHGSITTDTIWDMAGSPYIITGTVQVANGAMLTIQPNVVVKFALDTSLQIDGTLVAQNCTFTTNDPTPARGDWDHIFFTTTSVDAVYDANGNYTSGSMIQGCLVEWGGGGAGVNGAIEVSGASPYLDQNTIREITDGGGIHAVGRSTSNPIYITRNSISRASKSGDGGGIYVSAGQVISNTITNNSGHRGGGIYADESTLTGNIISNNTASGHGGGIYSTGSSVINNAISGNTGHSNGGGIQVTGGTIQGNTVTGNTLYPNNWEFVCGGGIDVSGGTLLDNIVNGNIVTGGFFNPQTGGGGICASLSTLTNNTVMNNTASTSTDRALGGGIYSTGSNLTLNQISGNSITGNTDAYGGGVYSKGGTLDNNTISNNSSTGGTVSQGGGVWSSNTTVSNNTVANNSSAYGGGLYADGASISENIIQDNNATVSGGGVYAINNATATENVITGNHAPSGGGMYGDGANLTGNTVENNDGNFGGGIYTNDSIVRGNALSQNEAQSDGGGVYIVDGSAEGNTISQNSVPSWGHGSGAYISGTVQFTSNAVVTNTASGGSAGGIAVGGGQPQIQYNNIYGNQPYDAEVLSALPVTATYNYWGAVPCTDIGLQVYDGDDIPGRGELLYAPSLYAPPVTAQLSTPTGLTLTEVDDTTVTLTWQPISDIPNIGCREPGSSKPDLGYRLYYDTNGMCSYDGQGLSGGDSPIDVGQDTTLTLTGFSPANSYYFSVTAYDYLGRESIYSTHVLLQGSEARKIFLPFIVRQG